MTTSVGLLNQATESLTLARIGRSVALELSTRLFTVPAEYFLQQGLSAIFGNATDEEFQRIYTLLARLQEQIQAGIDRISSEIKEAALEPPHATIATYHTNVIVGMRDQANPEAGAQAVYSAFFAGNEVEIANEVSQSLRIIRDVLLGRGAHQSSSYLDVLARRLYERNATIQGFQQTLGVVGTLYLTDFVYATLILAVLRDQTDSDQVRALLDEYLGQVGQLSDEIAEHLAALMRDIPAVEPAIESGQRFRIINRDTGRYLGRYAFAQTPRGRHLSWDIIEQDGANQGYVYLRAAGTQLGLDHFYGRDIRPIASANSTHPNHLWKLIPAASDPRWYRIQNKATGGVLDHYYGQDIRTAGLDEHPNHLWEILPDQSGNHYQIVNRATGAVLGIQNGDVDGFRASFSVGAGVYNPALDFDGVWDALLWSWETVDNAPEDFFNLVNIRSGQGLDHYYGRSFIFIPTPSPHPNHLWRVVPTRVSEDAAYCYIRNRATNQTLDHYYGRSIAGATDNNTESPHPNHIWKLQVVS